MLDKLRAINFHRVHCRKKLARIAFHEANLKKGIKSRQEEGNKLLVGLAERITSKTFFHYPQI